MSATQSETFLDLAMKYFVTCSSCDCSTDYTQTATMTGLQPALPLGRKFPFEGTFLENEGNLKKKILKEIYIL